MRDASMFVGRYELVRLVGTGGMGEVHEAIDRETGRRVAVKRLRIGEHSKPELVARFAREILATAKLTSRHVVAIHDAGRDDVTGEPFMVMDYLDGEDLERLSTRLGTLPVDLALRLAVQTCDGLIAAHAEHIIHRDIKPANLMLVAPTNRSLRIVKILDFGIARVRTMDVERDLTDLTQSGAFVGSPRYMAPEQLYGTRTLDHRADVWSLGVVLYRMLCGTTPHGDCESLAELVVAICSQPAPPLCERAPWVPRELGELVHRALHIDVEARLSSARELADELRRWLPDGADITDAMLVAHDRRADLATSHIEVSTTRPGAAATRAVSPTANQSATAPAPTPSRVPQAARAGYVVALLAVIALAGVYMVRSRHPSAVVADDATVAAVDDLPAALATTAGARWLHGVRPHCNPIEVGAALRDTPPPSGKDGRAFAIACVALSGEIARARAMVTALPAPERAYAVWPTFEVVHALADSHDAADTAVADALRFVLEFWPENYLALYHVGIAEYLSGDSRARDHLTRFLALHPGGDRFTLAARAIYTDIVTPTHDCRVLAVDPEGTTIHGLGCP